MIRLQELCVSYAGVPVLDHFSLTLPDAHVIAITGPSGAGKTTLLRALAGLLRPESGTITGLEGKRLSMVFQEDRLLPWYSAYENVYEAFPKEREGRDQLAKDWLLRMELQDSMNKFPRELSGGMQRRVALARACAYGGELLLLDEPFKGMDEALRARLAPHILSAAPRLILVTHDLEDAAMLGAALVPLPARPPVSSAATPTPVAGHPSP